MSGWSDIEEKAVLNWYFAGGAITPPSTLYLGLWTYPLNDDGSNLSPGETSYPSYARVALARSSGNWGVGAGDTPSNYVNLNLISFPTCSGVFSETVSHWALLSDPSGLDPSDLIFHGYITTPLLIELDVSPRIQVGDLVLELD